MLSLICGYAPQSGRSLEEKLSFYDELNCEWDAHSANDLLMCLGDFNGHVGRHIDYFDELHGGYGVCQSFFGRKNVIRVLSVCVKYVFFKREEKRKETLRMVENET